MRRIDLRDFRLNLLQYHLGDGIFGCVRDRKVNAGCSELVENHGGLARYLQGRGAAFEGNHLDIMPRDATAPAGLKRFQEGLLCGKAARV